MWRRLGLALFTCAVFIPFETCAATEPCRSLVRTPVRLIPSARDTSSSVCQITPDAPECVYRPSWAVLRCMANDPACGPDPPLSYRQCYRSHAKRMPPVAGASWKRLGPGGACRHDGECRLAGCDEICASYRNPPSQVRCYTRFDGEFPEPPRGPEPDDLLCGCVEGQCRFFVQ
jgi:hypothetical protein